MNRYNGHNSKDALVFHVSEYGRDYELGPHFQLWEMQCRDAHNVVFIHPALIVALNDLRREFGLIHINSGYRTPAYNAQIGGAANSFHMLGMAADVVALRATPSDVADWADSNNFGGVGRYNSFTHIDVRSTNRSEGQARWDNR